MPAKSEKIREFYKSADWRRVRQLKLLQSRGICERCGNPGTEIHHKIYLTNENVEDASIALNLDNLECLCKECHNNEHQRFSGQNKALIEQNIKNGRVVLSFDKDGNVIPPH